MNVDVADKIPPNGMASTEINRLWNHAVTTDASACNFSSPYFHLVWPWSCNF